ncbi:MAG: hypothetical protein JKY52_19765 [Flavobacteriales bacterium]|nr:hypothetical protein [Flavobacteriales bacterium]
MRFTQSNSVQLLNRTWAVLLFCLLLITVVGCEDDPILEEMSQSTAGGSYGKMIFPGDSVKTDHEHTLEKNNPSIF